MGSSHSDSNTNCAGMEATHRQLVSSAIDCNAEESGTTHQIARTPATRQVPHALIFEEDSDDDNSLILKPPGEAGRPGQGGYSLSKVLVWPSKKYDKVKVRIDSISIPKLIGLVRTSLMSLSINTLIANLP